MTAPSDSIRAADLACVAHPYTNLKTHQDKGPMVIVEGAGVRVFDAAGKSYIEGMAGLWCVSLGFSERRLVDAARQQMERLPFYHLFTHKAHNPAIELAERLIAMAPVPMSKVLFANSGSEANDTAIKLVWYYNNALGRPRKKKIISRHKGYHGVTVATSSLTALPNNQRDFDVPIDRIFHTDCPHYYRFAEAGESEDQFTTRLADNLERTILEEDPDTVAAFFAEPVMGAGGVIVPPDSYFPKIQAVLKKYDILFVVDEVICGFGRTGNMFGTQTYDLQPDMIALAKGLSSGYAPISALLLNERVWQAMVSESEKIGVFGHGSTYGPHPVSAAVAVETLKIYEERNILAHVRRVGPKLQAGLRELARHPMVGEARGVGLIGAVELVGDKATRRNFNPKLAVGAKVVEAAQRNGVILRAMPGDVIAFSPPLIISEAEIDEMLSRFAAALDEVAGDLAAVG